MSLTDVLPIKQKVPKRLLLMELLVDPLGLEPRMTIPKTVVLPITPWVILLRNTKV